MRLSILVLIVLNKEQISQISTAEGLNKMPDHGQWS